MRQTGDMFNERPDSTSPASWRRLLLIPTAARLGVSAPRDRRVGWDLFWDDVGGTGDDGDVLWDTSNPGEMTRYLPVVLEHLDQRLPVVDIGCGNGRQSRMLADHFPEVLGIDLSPIALDRARAESVGIDNLRFHALDLTIPDAGRVLADLIGPANVFVRGVFHIFSPKERTEVVTNLRAVLRDKGRLFLTETNYPGDSLSYLRHLGARPGKVPIPLQRAIARLPKPQPFGATQRAACLPEAEWQLHADGVADVYTIPLQSGKAAAVIPGYYAVVSPRSSLHFDPGSDRSPLEK